MSSSLKPANRVESFALTALFALASLGAVALLPIATQGGPAGSGWWTQPWFMPTLALGLLAIANALTLVSAWRDLRANPAADTEMGDALAAMKDWFRPIEFFAYFLGYIFILGRAGYFLSTLLFIQFLLFRVGLRSLRWVLAGLGAALALTAVFRWGLGIWVPTADLYGLFPDTIRKFMTRWL